MWKNQFVNGDVEMINGTVVPGVASAKSENDVAAKLDDKTLDQLLAEMDTLIGLQNVKKHIRDQITLINFNKLRRERC